MSEFDGQTTVGRLGSAAPQAIPSGTVDETAPQAAPTPESGATGAGAVLTTLEVLGLAERLFTAARRMNDIADYAHRQAPWGDPVTVLGHTLEYLDAEMDRQRDLRGRIWDALGRKP